MLNNLLKMTAITLIWKKYRRGIVAIAILIAYCWLVAIIHQDYLSYRALAGSDDTLGLSFILKWLAWLVGFAVYFFYDSDPAKAAAQRPVAHSDNNIHTDASDQPPRGDTDAFSAIRDKKKLRSKADVVIDKHRP